jgi:predicted ArsR family transcriptional regulator
MSSKDKELERQLDGLSALGEPVRRRLFLEVLADGAEVSRDEAASALQISRALAAFHLDRLVEAGLLEVRYRRLSGRSGPGAGRPSKLYRRGTKPIAVTFPARRHELAAELMANAVAGGGPTAGAALDRAAEDWGRAIGREARAKAGTADPARLTRAALVALRDAGFEPRRNEQGEILLGNCPFDALRSSARETICAMNLALCRGLVAGLEAPGFEVRLEPAPDRCCVILKVA